MEKKFGLSENFCKFEKELLNYLIVHSRMGTISQWSKVLIHGRNIYFGYVWEK